MCKLGADTESLVEWIKAARPQGELKVPIDVYSALLTECETKVDGPVLYYYNCKITVGQDMEFV